MATLQQPFIQKTITDLSAVLRGQESTDKKEEAIVNHLTNIHKEEKKFKLDINFPAGQQWFNIATPLSLTSHLKGKITILDFFTYCCINCIHILPDLHKIEQRFHDDGLVIVGVHSPKFPNEKESLNLLNAILRYDITHPVVNDVNIELWDALKISCWPTLVIIGPDLQLLYYIIGEGHYLELEQFLQNAIQYYKSCNLLSDVPVGVALEKNKCPSSALSFPGKLTAKSDVLYISDSSNHRILAIAMNTGLVKQVYGSGIPGRKDGVGQEAEFNGPQGLALCEGQYLYVADTENHLIRKVRHLMCINVLIDIYMLHTLFCISTL